MSVQQQNLSPTQEIYEKISKFVPEAEWRIHAPLIEKINKIKYNQYKDKFNLRASINKTSIKLNWRPKKNMSEEIVKLI